MSNQMITSEDYNMQMTLFPETDEKKVTKRRLTPTFKPYNNRQIHFIPHLTGSKTPTSRVRGGVTASKCPIGSTKHEWGMRENPHSWKFHFIYDIETPISEHHVARVVDEMVEAIPDEKLKVVEDVSIILK